jgi:hypothetical protein
VAFDEATKHEGKNKTRGTRSLNSYKLDACSVRHPHTNRHRELIEYCADYKEVEGID